MDDQQRAGFEAWASSVGAVLRTDKHGDYFYESTKFAWQGWQAALRAAPERELYEASRAFYNTISTIAVILDLKASLPESWKLVESTGARLCVALLNQHRLAVVTNGSQVVPPAALGAHEVHPEAVDAGLDLGEAGERLVAADALEHASGVRGDCDGSATSPKGFVLVPEVMDLDMEVAFCEAWFSKRRCIDDPEMQDAWAAALAARPQRVK